MSEGASELRADFDRLTAEIKAAKTTIRAINEQIAAIRARRDVVVMQAFGIEVGMRAKDRRREIIVDGVDGVYGFSRPLLVGRVIKKDGTPGDRRATLYSEWERVP